MSEIIKTIFSSAGNAFRSDGYTRSVGSYRQLGETAKRIQRQRRISLEKNIKKTNARTEQLGK